MYCRDIVHNVTAKDWKIFAEGSSSAQDSDPIGDSELYWLGHREDDDHVVDLYRLYIN